MMSSLYPHLIWSPNQADYNCSIKSFEEWKSTGLPSVLTGAYFMTVGIITMILYVIVISAMSCKTILRSPCLKIMYFNCYVDCGNVMTNSIVTGYLFITGGVYCTYPVLEFIFGAIGLGCWCAACFNCITIGINRLCVMTKRGNILFDGKSCFVWIGCSMFILLFMMFMTRPPVFNSALGAWFFYPMIQDLAVEATTIFNIFHAITNTLTAIMITALYSILCGYVGIKSRDAALASEHAKSSQHKVFVQSIVICLSTCCAAYIYAYMQFIACPTWLIMIASIAYQMCSVLPAFVYLTLNSQIRSRAMFWKAGGRTKITGYTSNQRSDEKQNITNSAE